MKENNQKQTLKFRVMMQKYLFLDNTFNKPIKFILRKCGLNLTLGKFIGELGLYADIPMKLIKNLVKKDNPVILEIGANTGTDTNKFIKTFKEITMYCFETDPRAIKIFKKKVNSSKIKIIEAAISDKNGYTTFHLSSGNSKWKSSKKAGDEWIYSSTIKKPINPSDFIEYKKDIKVKTIRLDNWVEKNNIGIIDFIWADVEGAEKELILDGLSTLNKKTRYFYTEYYDDEIYEEQTKLSEIQKLLPNCKIVGIFRSNVLMKNNLL